MAGCGTWPCIWGFWDGEVGETTAERKLKRVGGDGRVFGGDEIKSAEVVGEAREF